MAVIRLPGKPPALQGVAVAINDFANRLSSRREKEEDRKVQRERIEAYKAAAAARLAKVGSGTSNQFKVLDQLHKMAELASTQEEYNAIVDRIKKLTEGLAGGNLFPGPETEGKPSGAGLPVGPPPEEQLQEVVEKQKDEHKLQALQWLGALYNAGSGKLADVLGPMMEGAFLGEGDTGTPTFRDPLTGEGVRREGNLTSRGTRPENFLPPGAVGATVDGQGGGRNRRGNVVPPVQDLGGPSLEEIWGAISGVNPPGKGRRGSRGVAGVSPPASPTMMAPPLPQPWNEDTVARRLESYRDTMPGVSEILDSPLDLKALVHRLNEKNQPGAGGIPGL